MNYIEFLQNKSDREINTGFNPVWLPEFLFDFQKELTEWAIMKGRAALFEDCGLGKTPQQLVWAENVCRFTGGNVLILAPLAVSMQTKREGNKFGINTTICRTQADVKQGINITNYQMLEHFDTEDFTGVVLDESSILKSFMGKTKIALQQAFKNTKYKLCCTATPSPNDYMELLNQADFLSIMPSNEALARWFILDTMNSGKYRIKGHAMKDFWQWVGTWAACVSKPSDIGYDDGNFKLPKLHIHEITVKIDQIKGREKTNTLFRIPETSATGYNHEKRLTIKDRALKIAEIVNNFLEDESFAIWCDTNFEADELKKLIPQAVEIRGSDSLEKKEQTAMDFINKKIPGIISKSSIFGFGLNFQHCHNTLFCGMSYSYEKFYQATRRFWRFGQPNPVNVYLVLGDTESNILSVVRGKMQQHEDMKKNMRYSVDKFNMNRGRRTLTMDYESNVAKGKDWTAILGDSCEEIKKIKDESIHFSIFSPPFSNLYIYSDSIRDMGNCKNDKEFFRQFKFLIPEVKRITKVGRLCAVHCKQLVNYKNRDGAFGIRDFRGTLIRAFVGAGWVFHSEVCIWKDPVIEMQRTKSHGLLYCEMRKDSTHSRVGLPEYLLLFRKWGDTQDKDPDPVTHTKDNFPLEKWQEYASPVWKTIRQTNVLNVRQARESSDEKHIAPLQLDIIERAVELWSNPGDVVFSPFMGIGSEGYMSIKMNRKFVGIELKEIYWNAAIKYMSEVEKDKSLPTLFDMEVVA
jgi:hypothetical protein